MKLFFYFSLFLILFTSCKSENKLDADRFKHGVFEIPAGDNYSKTIIIRKDSLQIETYENRVDTLVIKWRNNFKYSLKMLNPKKPSDKDEIFVIITNIKEDSYEFEAKVGFSNFTQKGTLKKIANK